MPTIQIDEIRFYDEHDAHPQNAGIDGFVVFRLLGVPGRSPDYITMRFRRGDSTQTPLNELVWGWDGDRKAPTLKPSLRYEEKHFPIVHVNVTAGRIVCHGDCQFEAVNA